MNLFNEVLRAQGDKVDSPALVMRLDSGGRRSYSYGQMFQRVDEYSHILGDAGIIRGDRVAIIAENSPEWAIAFLAITRLECAAVVFDPSLPDGEIANLLVTSSIRAVMASPTVLGKLKTELPLFDILDGGKHISGDATHLPPTQDSDPSIAVIFFSSGTTNTAKAVMHTNESIMTSARNIITHYMIVAGDSFLAVIPFFHIYGFMGNFICPLLAGASVCTIESVSSQSLMNAFVDFRPTVFNGVPRVFNMFRAKIEERVKSRGPLAAMSFRFLHRFCSIIKPRLGINLGQVLFVKILAAFGGNLRGCISAGAYLPPETAKFFDALGVFVFDAYGLTETGVPVAANNLLTGHDFDTIGKPLTGVCIRIHDPDKDQQGEVRVKSTCMMKGYFMDPDATREAFDNEGWFMTGDVGYLNKHGNLVLTGRIKDNIVLATGKKLSPSDIEARYPAIAGVKEFVVCGVSDSGGSADEIHGFVVRDDEMVREEADIEADYRTAGYNLPAYMRVGKLHFLREIPQTALGKPKRYLLRIAALNSASDSATNLKTPIEEERATAEGKRIGGETGLALEGVLEITSILNQSGKTVTGTSRLVEDLGFDSLSLTELFSVLYKHTGRDFSWISRPDLTVNDVARGIEDSEGIDSAPSLGDFPMNRGLFAHTAYAIVSAFSKLVYRIEVSGMNQLPASGGYILCPNHETHLDGLWIMMQLPREHRERFSCMAKSEHLNTPFGRLMLRVAGGIPVDRRGNTTPAFNRCLERLREGGIVMIHPEGTRTEDGSIGSFKSGASKLGLKSGLPIVPVKIDGGFAIYPKHRKLPRLFNPRSGRRFHLKVCFGTPIQPKDHSVEELTRSLRNTIESLGIKGGY